MGRTTDKLTADVNTATTAYEAALKIANVEAIKEVQLMADYEKHLQTNPNGYYDRSKMFAQQGVAKRAEAAKDAAWSKVADAEKKLQAFLESKSKENKVYHSLKMKVKSLVT